MLSEECARVLSRAGDSTEGETTIKILLATDGSACGDAAVEEVARRPWPADSQVRVLTTVEPTAPLVDGPYALLDSYFEEAEKLKRKQAEETLSRAAALLRESAATYALSVSTEARSGPARRTIVEEAERWGAGLIVVGSHGYRTWERMLLGSVSQAVAAHAECSVEIVRGRRK